MTYKEHLKILKKGVPAWNKWREKNPEIKSDLSEADLSYMNLREANLMRANLSEADLSKARLHGADLSWADLSKARLHGADLSFVNLMRANLSEADFKSAVFDGTIFSMVDLSQTRHLKNCKHYGPSVIDHQTLRKSGKLPLTFLRGVGLPDEFIKYLPSFIAKPIQFYSCFISYSSRNQDFADRIYADLQNKGVRCWFASEHMKIGDEIRPRIDVSIRTYDKLLLVLSKESIKSKWVKKEVETAFEKEGKHKKLVLFPVRIDNAVMETNQAWAADIRRTRHIGDFCNWKNHDMYQKAFERLLRDLKQEVSSVEAKKEV